MVSSFVNSAQRGARGPARGSGDASHHPLWYAGVTLMPARLKALLLLAWALVRTLVRRALGKGRRGLAAFRANYDADRLPPVTAGERHELGQFGRCISCGLCDRGEAERILASSGRYRGIMALMVESSRSMPDFAAAALAFAEVPDAVLLEKEAGCPTRVPMRRVAAFVRAKALETSSTK